MIVCRTVTIQENFIHLHFSFYSVQFLLNSSCAAGLTRQRLDPLPRSQSPYAQAPLVRHNVCQSLLSARDT